MDSLALAASTRTASTGTASTPAARRPRPALRTAATLLGALVAAALLVLMGGCSSLPPPVQRTPSFTEPAEPQAPLPRLVRGLDIPPGLSAVRPMPMPHHALAARMALIEQARRSIDLQTYLIADDATGRSVLRALADAADRGVRVRLLLDDMYTEGLDDLLLGLAAHGRVEVRLYNPFGRGRGSAAARLWQLATDFGRLNHRMHNKLFIADGAMAVVGGRNLADDYFLRNPQSNFIDFDMLAAGAVLEELDGIFDAYWNSERSWPLHALAQDEMEPARRRAWFERATAGDAAPLLVPGLPPVPAASALHPAQDEAGPGLYGFYIAPAGAHADPPDKVRRPGEGPLPGTVAGGLLRLLGEARSEVILVSPYFVPGRLGLERMRSLREQGVSLRIVTNGTGTSDEPVVSLGYERHRQAMLRLGVQLFEVSSSRLKHEDGLRRVLGSSTGRLHAKMGFIDRSVFLAGSLNLDARSALINTELGMVVRSPALVAAMLHFYRIDSEAGLYELKLGPDGESIVWTARDDDGHEQVGSEPEANAWLRFKLWLLSHFVPEDQL